MALAIPLTINRRQQAGAFTILSAFTLLVLLMFLALVLDSGRLYMEQRKLQKVADTSALGAIFLLPDGNCSTNTGKTLENALANAEKNHFSDPGKLKIRCMKMEIENGLRKASSAADGRAVEVTVAHTVPSSMVMQIGSIFNNNIPDKITLQATAIAARDEPVAAFSVGSQLLKLHNNKLLGTLLSTVGLQPELLTVLDQHGVANLSVTPSGLLKKLGIGVGVDLKALTPDKLAGLVAEADLFGYQLVNATVALLRDSAAAVNLELLEELRLLGEEPLIRDLELNLIASEQMPRGILSLITASPDDPVGAALDTAVNLGDLLSTVILVGASEQRRALIIGNPDGADANALKLLNTVQVELGVVEPPSIGVGPEGTKAYNAQIRLKVEINTDEGLLGGLLKLLGTSINLPIIIDLANASGTLSTLSCGPPPADSLLKEPGAIIDVTAGLGSVCIGDMGDAMWSTRRSCNDVVEEQKLIEVLGLLKVEGKINLRLLETENTPLIYSLAKLQHHQQMDPPQPYTLTTEDYPNPLLLGNLIKDLVQEVLNLLGNAPEARETLNKEQAEVIADEYLAISELQPALPGYYTFNELKSIGARLKTDGVNWDRPGYLIGLNTDEMVEQWLDGLRLCASAGNGCPHERVRKDLIKDLQTKPRLGLINAIVTGLLGEVVVPVLTPILDPLLELLAGLLNAVGKFILSPLLDDLLGLSLTNAEVTLHDMACGTPRLVR